MGRGGAMLKEIGTQARQGIEALLDRPVHLELWVKVHPNWQMDRAFLLRLGY
ncbi:MAG: KH domain-containing protein [Dehalococcoidia bacterium]|nr:KH domain-containing protein [Dehalococcoidia bacterium]